MNTEELELANHEWNAARRTSIWRRIALVLLLLGLMVAGFLISANSAPLSIASFGGLLMLTGGLICLLYAPLIAGTKWFSGEHDVWKYSSVMSSGLDLKSAQNDNPLKQTVEVLPDGSLNVSWNISEGDTIYLKLSEGPSLPLYYSRESYEQYKTPQMVIYRLREDRKQRTWTYQLVGISN